MNEAVKIGSYEDDDVLLVLSVIEVSKSRDHFQSFGFILPVFVSLFLNTVHNKLGRYVHKVNKKKKCQ
jgi:hypothetical protein